MDTFAEQLKPHMPENTKGWAIVFCYVDMPPGNFFEKFRAEFDYGPMNADAVISARIAYPNAHVFFVTDKTTVLEPVPKAHIARVDFKPHEYGLERLKLWAAFCGLWEGGIIFLDSDMFVRSPLKEYISPCADFALSWRPPTAPTFKEMPINGGLVVANNTQATKLYLESCATQTALFAEAHNDASLLAGYGEQRAMSFLTRYRGPGLYKTFWGQCGIYHIDEINYNYDGSDPDSASRACIWHLKGNLKVKKYGRKAA
jgi:hypothetical protein